MRGGQPDLSTGVAIGTDKARGQLRIAIGCFTAAHAPLVVAASRSYTYPT